ncbi:MAG: hypothetical protein M0P61_01615 [Ignavibacteriaceae bacterium]|jgi:hypothetical protein|nr:hypothetical protein [Ignavibacteriaceae bacterium]
MIEDANLFCDEIEKFSENKLLVKQDLLNLVIIAGRASHEELFFSIAFSAKYVQGLLRVIQQAGTNPEIKNLVQIKNDLAENMEMITADLKTMITNESNEVNEKFEAKYLALTAESFANLRKLLNDLEWVKIYHNHLKRIK